MGEIYGQWKESGEVLEHVWLGFVRGMEVEVRENAFVIRTFRNGLGVFVSKSVFLPFV